MKNLHVLSFLILLALNSCTWNTSTRNEENTPEALQEGSKWDYDYSLKRGSDGQNIVDELFKEKRKSDETLNELMEEIETLRKSKNETVEDLQNFLFNSEKYYSDALIISNQIQDSLLKQELQTILEKSQKQFEKPASELQAKIDKVQAEDLSLYDFQKFLKVAITLEMIEDYQKNNQPDASELTEILKKYQELQKKVKKSF